MFLSQLKVNGFKSFAQRTHLDFSKGITCIIGPNGCGKSNIVDAIRWVIGEQKAGTLRSEKMTDVIFNGNKKRKALGLAEVSLTIINDRGILPSEYSEIELARRVYRDGQSEYLLNNQTCRLKDIQDLFMDSGMGSDAYSVIELKMVEQILSQNNSERRLLFEEAAGIKKYKQRRKSAFRKLDDTKQSLLRIEDILEEVSKVVRSLERQVQKAKKYQELKKSLEELDLQAAAFNFHKLQGKIEPLIERLEESKSEQENNSNQLNLDESLIEKYKLELLETEGQLNEQRNAVFAHDERIRLIHEEELLSNEKSKNSHALIERLQNEIQHIEDHKIRADQLITEKRKELETIQLELESADEKKQESDDEISELMNTLDQVSKALLKTDSLYRNFQKELNAVNQKIDQLKFQESDLEKRLDASKAVAEFNASYYEDRIMSFEKKLNSFKKQHQDKAQELETMKELRQETADRLNELNQNKTKADKEFLAIESKRNVIEDTLLSGELLPETVQSFLQSADEYEGYLGVLSELIRIDDKRLSDLEFLLQQYASLPVFRSITATELSSLKKTFPSLRFFILSERKTKTLHANSIARDIESDHLNRDEINSLFAPFLFAENERDVLKLMSSSHIILSPFGYFSGSEGIFQTAQSKESEFSILGAQNQINELEQKLDHLQDQISRYEDDLFKYEDAKLSHEASFNRLNSELNHIIKTEIECQAELEKTHYEYNHKKESYEAFIKEQELLTQRLEAIKRELSDLEPAFESKLFEEDQLEQKLKQLRLDRDEQNKKIAEAKESYYSDKLRFQELTTHANSIKELLKREYSFLKNADQDIENKKRERETLSTEGSSIQSESEKRQEILSKMHDERELLLGEKLRIEEHFRSLREQIQEMEQDAKAAQKRRESFLDSVQKIELKLNELSIKSQTIGERIFHDYQLDVKEIPVPENFEILKAEQEVYQIKNRIANLGEVNALAIEDYKKEKERLDFLQQQHDDLVSAENMLLDTIDTINSTAKENFDRVFEQVRLNFQLVYKQFFANGEGDLELVNKDDPLESQIDIKVSPKGKSLQTLALLSGGEKTLTAISLLFSIYLVKPSPFCILDEVDAPLDDVNISRFTTALKSFTDRTQFIVITHNKRTMEASDYMYGVTQEESGISKLVSVNFTR